MSENHCHCWDRCVCDEKFDALESERDKALQEARFNGQIANARLIEIDRLKEELDKENKLKELNDWHERWVQSEKEIDRLKADLEALRHVSEMQSIWTKDVESHEALVCKDRDLWKSRGKEWQEKFANHNCADEYRMMKSKAEKLAEALRKLESCNCEMDHGAEE